MIKVKLPKTLKIGGFDYKIKLDNKTTTDLSDRQRYREHSESFREIRLNTNFSEQQLSASFIHEVLHSVDTVYNHFELEEKENGLLANGIHQVLEGLGIRFIA
jgi:hypothetical protein